MKCDLDTLLDIHARSIRVENEVFVPYNRQERLVRLFEAVKLKFESNISLIFHYLSHKKDSCDSGLDNKCNCGLNYFIRETGFYELESCSCIRIVGETTEGLSRKASEWHTNGCKIHEEEK